MSDATGPRRPIYGGGIDAVLARMEGRRDPFDTAAGEGLPPLDVDLRPLVDARVGDPEADPAEAPPFRSGYHRKRHAIRSAFVGGSELAALHALVIAHLRKRSWPAQAPALFRRLWAEQPGPLLAELDARWLVSAITTFGDHGDTPAQRATGLALSTLFAAMKLYETERLFSGADPHGAFARGDRRKATLPLDMDAYAIDAGGLDVNTLGRLWQEAQGDPVIRPLAEALLQGLLRDRRSVLARLSLMRAEKLRWGVVCTAPADAAPEALRGWVAHHLSLGAETVMLFIDVPDGASAGPDGASLRSGSTRANPDRRGTGRAAMPTDDTGPAAPIGSLDALDHPRVSLTLCDAAYWARIGKPRPERAFARATVTASRSYRAMEKRLDWLIHLGPDDHLAADGSVALALAEADWRADWLRIAPHGDGDTAGPGDRAGRAAARPAARTGLRDARLTAEALRRDGRDLDTVAPAEGLRLAPLDAEARAAAIRAQFGDGA